jgi:hypothetical protein
MYVSITCDASTFTKHPFSCQMLRRNEVEMFVIDPSPRSNCLEGQIVLFNQFCVHIDPGLQVLGDGKSVFLITRFWIT